MLNFICLVKRKVCEVFKNKTIIMVVAVTIFIIGYFIFEFVNNYKSGGFILNGDSADDEMNKDGEVNESFESDNEFDAEKSDGKIVEKTNQSEQNTGNNSDVNENIQDNGSVTDISEIDNDIIGENKINEEKILVYVTGEVNNEGVITLDKGSRITDAINAAGGTTSNANISKINLVYILEDGMKVNIPNDNDLKNNPDFDYITIGSGDGDTNSNMISNNKDSLYSDDIGKGKTIDIVNINTATQTELETLPGIGPSLALKIINYRNENGKFSSIDDIKNVSGIGDSKFENIKKYIVV